MAHGLAEALGGERPFASLQPPLPAQTVEIADDAAVPARFGQLFGVGEVLFAQIALPEADLSV
jgi:hypothetical protein